jgi:hypothetical protein
MSKLEQIYVGLGKGSYKVEVVSSAILALVTFFYAYTISTFLRLHVFVLQDRVVYDRPFEQYVIGEYADHLVISVGLLIWLFISLRRAKIRNVVCIIYGGLLIAAIALEPLLFEIISLVVFPVIIIFIGYQKFALLDSEKGFLVVNGSLFLAYFSLIFIALSVVSIILSLQPFVSSSFFSNPPPRNYLYEIFVMLSPASAALMVLIVFSYPLKLVFGEILVLFSSKLRRFVPYFAYLEEQKLKSGHDDERPPQESVSKNGGAGGGGGAHISLNLPLAGEKRKRRRRKTILLLLPILVFSSTLTLIPYQPAFNVDNRLVGVDTGYQYTRWLNNLINSSGEGWDEFTKQLISVQGVNGDRPLSLFLIYLALQVTNTDDISHMIDRSPVLLAPMLVLAVYFLTRQLTPSYSAPFIAAFLTTVSFQVLIGIFAGFFANWIALITGYFCLGYLFKFLKDPSKPKLTIFAVLLIATLFAHVYTWTVISLSAGLFVITMLILKRREYSRKALILILIVIVSSVIIDVAKSLATSSSSGVFRDVEFTDVRMGLNEFAQRWSILVFSVYFGLGGIFANSVIIVLALYWILRSSFKDTSTIFLLVFFSIAIIPLFFGDWIVQSRTIYMIPFQIPAALGLTSIILNKSRKSLDKHSNQSTVSVTRTSVTRIVSSVAICSVLTAVAVIVLSNLYRIFPPR